MPERIENKTAGFIGVDQRAETAGYDARMAHTIGARFAVALVVVVAVAIVPLSAVAAPAVAASSDDIGAGVTVTRVAVIGPSDGSIGAAAVSGIAVPDGASIAVLTWQGDPGAEFVARSFAGSAFVSTHEGITASHDAADVGEQRTVDRYAAAPVWLADEIDRLEVTRRAGAAHHLRVDFLTVPARAPVVTSAAVVAAGAQPAIRPNEDWGNPGWVHANEDCEDGPSEPGYLDRAAIHHTVSSNSYPPSAVDDLLIGIYYGHTQVNGWCDIGYNFVIDRFGTIWEGRTQSIEKPIQGGHTSGINPGSVGIALLGSHQPGGPNGAVNPPPGAAALITSIVSWKFSQSGANPLATVQVGVKNNDTYPLVGQRLTVPAIYGHREVEATSCPGDLAMGLVSQVRQSVVVVPPTVQNILVNNVHADGRPAVTGRLDVGDHRLFIGDWNGDGMQTFGYYEAPNYYLWNSMDSTEPDLIVKYGRPGDTALVGDWDGDGVDTIGVRRANLLFLRNTNTPGPADEAFSFGRAGDEVLVGDWNGDDSDTVGTRRGNVIYLNNAFRSGEADITYGFGRATDDVFVGDWDGDRVDTLGVRRGARLFLGNRLISGAADLVYDYGTPDTHVEYGDWNGDWIDTPLTILD